MMTPDKDLVAESCPRQDRREKFRGTGVLRLSSGRTAVSESFKKLQLGENHRRVVSVLIRRVEAACEGILQDLDRRSGLLHSVQDDVSPEQAKKLRELAGKLRAEVERVESEVRLDPAVRSRKRSIAARVSSAIIDLEEVSGSALRGYGEMPKELEQALAEKFARFIAVLQEMERIAESTVERK
jgi:hypothetical protein